MTCVFGLQQQQQQQVVGGNQAQQQGQMLQGLRPAGGAIAPPLASSMPKEALQQLLITLKSPNSPDQQQQILQVSISMSRPAEYQTSQRMNAGKNFILETVGSFPISRRLQQPKHTTYRSKTCLGSYRTILGLRGILFKFNSDLFRDEGKAGQ